MPQLKATGWRLGKVGMEVGPAGSFGKATPFPPAFVITTPYIRTNSLSSNRAMLNSHSATVSCRLRGDAAIGYRRLK